MKVNKSMVWPIAGATMVAGAALSMALTPNRKKKSAQKAAGRAIKAVGEAVEHFSGQLKM